MLPQTERAFLLRRFAPVLVLAALTGACSSGPAPATYDLSAPSSRIRGAAGVQVLVNEPAALQQLATQQILVKDASGKIQYVNIMEFDGRAVQDAFSRAVIGAVLDHAPDALDHAEAHAS